MGTEKLCEPELIEISCTMYIHVRAFHQLTDSWLSLKILEKRKSKLPVFFLYGSSFDIVRWDMTLKKKKKSSLVTKSVMYCHDSMQFDIIIFYLISLPPPNPERSRGTSLHEWIQKAIFFCVFFSYFLRRFTWCFEKAEKIASMSETLKKGWYNKHNKPLIYRQQLTVR